MGPRSWRRNSTNLCQQSTSAAPLDGRGRSVTSRAGSSAASQVQILEKLRSFGCRTAAPERQIEVRRNTIPSPTCVSAPRTSLPGIEHTTGARRLVELGCVADDPANVTRPPTATCVRAVPLPDVEAAGGPRGLDGSWSRRAMLLEPRQELNCRQVKRVSQLEDTFAANVEEFDSRIADAQGSGGVGGPNGHHAGGLEMTARTVRSKETHPEAIIQTHVKRVKSEI